MAKRLKQIKNADLGASAKKVIDSLIIPQRQHKEEKLEQMRCKVEILEGSVKPHLIDSFVVNTNSLDKLMTDIFDKFGDNVQYKITNLFNEVVVAKRLTYTGGYDKEKTDKEHFNDSLDVIRKIQKMRDDGKLFEDIRSKYAFRAGDSYISLVYNSTEEQMIQRLRNSYENQSLGKTPNSDILSKSLSTNKDILPTINVESEQTEPESETSKE